MAELVQPRMALKMLQPFWMVSVEAQHLQESEERERVKVGGGLSYVDVPNALVDII